MPYFIKGNCIYKKDGGTKVGCTNGDVHKYMSALHANASESTLIEKLVKEKLNNLSIYETLLDEDYPTSFDMNKFKTLSSFDARIKYCTEHLKRISSGSSRIVFKIDNEKVLKLAKNNKGIAQNKIEGDLNLRNNWYSGILANVIDASDNNLWIEMELAKPVKNQDFKNFIGYDLPTIMKFLEFMYYKYIISDDGAASFYELPTNIVEDLLENEFTKDLVNMMAEHRIDPADFGKKSSYGIVTRDGNQEMVLIDFGMTNEVYAGSYS